LLTEVFLGGSGLEEKDRRKRDMGGGRKKTIKGEEAKKNIKLRLLHIEFLTILHIHLLLFLLILLLLLEIFGTGCVITVSC